MRLIGINVFQIPGFGRERHDWQRRRVHEKKSSVQEDIALRIQNRERIGVFFRNAL